MQRGRRVPSRRAVKQIDENFRRSLKTMGYISFHFSRNVPRLKDSSDAKGRCTQSRESMTQAVTFRPQKGDTTAKKGATFTGLADLRRRTSFIAR
jgi:hypothetical protein